MRKLKAIRESDTGNIAEFKETQRLFMGKYLGMWIFDFCERIRRNTEIRFYKTLSGCVSSFIAHDKDNLNSSIARSGLQFERRRESPR